MFSFYSCTCILHTLLDVVSKNYSVKQTRKEADDEKTNSENSLHTLLPESPKREAVSMGDGKEKKKLQRVSDNF